MLYLDAPITPKALKMTMSTLSHFPTDFLYRSLTWIYNVQSQMVIPSMILLNTFFPILMIILTTTLTGPTLSRTTLSRTTLSRTTLSRTTLSRTTQHFWTLKDDNMFPPTLTSA